VTIQQYNLRKERGKDRELLREGERETHRGIKRGLITEKETERKMCELEACFDEQWGREK
jgi:hypothetical protein